MRLMLGMQRRRIGHDRGQNNNCNGHRHISEDQGDTGSHNKDEQRKLFLFKSGKRYPKEGTEMMFVCKECGYGYGIQSQLDEHMRTTRHPCKHRDDGMVKCADCDRFESQTNRMGYDDFMGIGQD